MTKGYYADWTRVFAHGALANVRMARNNSRCASNVYVAFGENLKPDYKFAGDTEFYLNSISAAQNFYVAFQDWYEGLGWLYTVWPLGPLFELVYRGSSLTMIIVTIMLQGDIAKLGDSEVAETDKEKDADDKI